MKDNINNISNNLSALSIATKELAFQNEEKEKRAAELVIANEKLIYQNNEKEKRAAELVIANKELLFQNEEKDKRAAELVIANKELLFQNEEKEKRAAELAIANKELLFQNEEKEKRAVELAIANEELLLQNKEKEKLAAELIVANKELAFQNEEKEKRAIELLDAQQKVLNHAAQLEAANNELEAFSYSVSHDLRAPLRAVNGFAKMLRDYAGEQLDTEAQRLVKIIQDNATKMGQLIDDLLTFSRLGRKELQKVNLQMQDMVATFCNEIQTENPQRNIQFTIHELKPAFGDKTTIKQVWVNLLSNAVKYSQLSSDTIIEIGCNALENETVYYVKDQGAGFDMRYSDKLFGVFQRLHSEKEFEGTGVGLAIVKRIVSKHGGRVWAEGKINEGATFYFSIPL